VFLLYNPHLFKLSTIITYTYIRTYNQLLILYRYIMFGKGICEKYQSRDEKFPEPNGEGNLVSRLVFFANTPPKHDISV